MIYKALAAAALVIAAALPVGAQQAAPSPVEVKLDVQRIARTADGREARESADRARPGDTLEYAVTYRNAGREPVRDLLATLPIPSATEFVAGSARPANARASLDARDFAAMPLKRKVKRDGRDIDEAVPLREYRYLRWTVGELRAGEALTFVARVRILE